MRAIRLIGKMVLCILTLPIFLAVILAKWFAVFLHHCSAWLFYIISSALFAAAVLSYFMKQSSGNEAIVMLAVGFIIFMAPYMTGLLVAGLEVLSAAITRLWYI